MLNKLYVFLWFYLLSLCLFLPIWLILTILCLVNFFLYFSFALRILIIIFCTWGVTIHRSAWWILPFIDIKITHSKFFELKVDTNIVTIFQFYSVFTWYVFVPPLFFTCSIFFWMCLLSIGFSLILFSNIVGKSFIWGVWPIHITSEIVYSMPYLVKYFIVSSFYLFFAENIFFLALFVLVIWKGWVLF